MILLTQCSQWQYNHTQATPVAGGGQGLHDEHRMKVSTEQ